MRNTRAAAIPAIALGAAAAVLLLALQACTSSPSTVTCKERRGTQYALCVTGHSGVVIVPATVYRLARVGDTFTEGNDGIVVEHPAVDPAPVEHPVVDPVVAHPAVE